MKLINKDRVKDFRYDRVVLLPRNNNLNNNMNNNINNDNNNNDNLDRPPIALAGDDEKKNINQ